MKTLPKNTTEEAVIELLDAARAVHQDAYAPSSEGRLSLAYSLNVALGKALRAFEPTLKNDPKSVPVEFAVQTFQDSDGIPWFCIFWNGIKIDLSACRGLVGFGGIKYHGVEEWLFNMPGEGLDGPCIPYKVRIWKV